MPIWSRFNRQPRGKSRSHSPSWETTMRPTLWGDWVDEDVYDTDPFMIREQSQRRRQRQSRTAPRTRFKR